MSSQGSPTLELDVGHRRTEKWVAAACILGAAGAPLLAGTQAAVDISMFSIVPVSLFAAGAALSGFRSAGWIGRRRGISRIAWQADGRWFLTDRAGCQLEATLRGDTRVGAGHAWLRWDVQPPGWGSRAMLLAPGDVSEPDLRRLSTRLRIDNSAGHITRAVAPDV